MLLLRLYTLWSHRNLLGLLSRLLSDFLWYYYSAWCLFRLLFYWWADLLFHKHFLLLLRNVDLILQWLSFLLHFRQRFRCFRRSILLLLYWLLYYRLFDLFLLIDWDIHLTLLLTATICLIIILHFIIIVSEFHPLLLTVNLGLSAMFW